MITAINYSDLLKQLSVYYEGKLNVVILFHKHITVNILNPNSLLTNFRFSIPTPFYS